MRKPLFIIVEVIIHITTWFVSELILDRDRRRGEDARLGVVVSAFTVVVIAFSVGNSALAFITAASVVALQVKAILLAVLRHSLERRQGEVSVVACGAGARQLPPVHAADCGWRHAGS